MKFYTLTEPYEHYDPSVDRREEVGLGLIVLINEDWSIFAASIQDYEIDNRLLFDILNENEYGKHYDQDKLYSKIDDSEYYEDPLFEWKLYWKELKNELKHENRFFLFFDINNRLMDILRLREIELPEGEILYRARLGIHKKECMLAPPKDRARAGRANPVGISYLYCATGEETSVAEIRPWKGTVVTVARLRLKKKVKIIDLTNKNISPFAYEFADTLTMKTVVDNFARELSTPVDPNKTELDYLPTQYISELIKSRGFEGIRFKSVMGPDDNIVLFSEQDVKAVSTETHKIKDIKYIYKEAFDFPEEIFENDKKSGQCLE